MISTITTDLKFKNGVATICMKEYPNWYGIEDIGFIWHGQWSDPEIEYNGHVINSTIVEDTMWERYREECEEQGIKTDEDYFDEHYMKEHADEVYELIELAIEGM